MDTLRPTMLRARATTSLPTGSAGCCSKLRHHESTIEPKELYADYFGILHLYVQPPSEIGRSIKLDTQLEDRMIALEQPSQDEETAECPFNQLIRPDTESCKQPPGLSNEEAQSLSDEERVRLGYSPRPILPNDTISEH